MALQVEIRTKGSIEEQALRFASRDHEWRIADNECGRVAREHKGNALWQQGKALILQNPIPSDLKKNKKK